MMALSASLTKGYLKEKPNSLAFTGSTLCPSKTCNQLRKYQKKGYIFIFLSMKQTRAPHTHKQTKTITLIIKTIIMRDHGVNERMMRGTHTIEAPSPRTALSAKSGTGNHEGRPMTCPNCSHISANRTGFGAVPLITPVMLIINHKGHRLSRETVLCQIS